MCTRTLQRQCTCNISETTTQRCWGDFVVSVYVCGWRPRELTHGIGNLESALAAASSSHHHPDELLYRYKYGSWQWFDNEYRCEFCPLSVFRNRHRHLFSDHFDQARTDHEARCRTYEEGVSPSFFLAHCPTSDHVYRICRVSFSLRRYPSTFTRC